MIVPVLNLIFLEVQFECDFLKKNLVKIPVYSRYADGGIPVFGIRNTDSLYDDS